MPGIDVPFHSSELHAGVADFRATLDGLLPERIDPSVLVGRYIPNLVPRLFTLDKEFVEEVASYVHSPLLEPALEDWATWEADPARLGRTLLIELLAWQFASPVRWIETQDLLFGMLPDGLAIEQFVEVGVANAPTLANLASNTVKLPSYDGIAPSILNSSRDAGVVFATDTPAVDDDEEAWPRRARHEPEAPAETAEARPLPRPPPPPLPARSVPPTSPTPRPTRPRPWPRCGPRCAPTRSARPTRSRRCATASPRAATSCSSTSEPSSASAPSTAPPRRTGRRCR